MNNSISQIPYKLYLMWVLYLYLGSWKESLFELNQDYSHDIILCVLLKIYWYLYIFLLPIAAQKITVIGEIIVCEKIGLHDTTWTAFRSHCSSWPAISIPYCSCRIIRSFMLLFYTPPTWPSCCCTSWTLWGRPWGMACSWCARHTGPGREPPPLWSPQTTSSGHLGYVTGWK